MRWLIAAALVLLMSVDARAWTDYMCSADGTCEQKQWVREARWREQCRSQPEPGQCFDDMRRWYDWYLPPSAATLQDVYDELVRQRR